MRGRSELGGGLYPSAHYVLPIQTYRSWKEKKTLNKKLCFGCYDPINRDQCSTNCPKRTVCNISKENHLTGVHRYKSKRSNNNTVTDDGGKSSTGFPIVGGMGGGPHLTIFFENTPHQNRCPPWGTPSLKMKFPRLPPLKHETHFHEMIPRKSTINNNLKSS